MLGDIALAYEETSQSILTKVNAIEAELNSFINIDKTIPTVGQVNSPGNNTYGTGLTISGRCKLSNFNTSGTYPVEVEVTVDGGTPFTLMVYSSMIGANIYSNSSIYIRTKNGSAGSLTCYLTYRLY